MRLEMGNQGVQAYIAPMGDNHQVTLVLCYHTVLGIHIFTSLPHKAILSVLSVCMVCPDHRGVIGFLVCPNYHLLATIWFCWLPRVCWLHCVFSMGLLAYQANKKHRHFRTKIANNTPIVETKRNSQQFDSQ